MQFPLWHKVWLPLAPTRDLEKRDARDLVVFGRLTDGASLADAQAEIDLLAERLKKEHPGTNQRLSVKIEPYTDTYLGDVAPTLFLAMVSAVGFVLLIACVNVANLLLSRSLSRAKEVAIRTALGASRGRLVRQLLIESALLGVLGAVCGLILSIWGLRVLWLAVLRLAPEGMPYWMDPSMDYRVFGYLAAICLMTIIFSGLVPALYVTRVDVNDVLKEGARGSSGPRNRLLSGYLVVGEVMLAFVLLVGAGLMIRSFLKVYDVTSALESEQVLTLRVNLPTVRYPKPEDRIGLYEQLSHRFAEVPGVERVALASHLPVTEPYRWKFELVGQPSVETDDQLSVHGLVISPEYFQVLGLGLLSGLNFTEQDGSAGNTVTMVNQRFANKYWPAEDPLGKRLQLVRDEEELWVTVIGVAPDVKQSNPNEAENVPVIYLPYRQEAVASMVILVRTSVGAYSVTGALRKQVETLDDELALSGVMLLPEHLADERWEYVIFGSLFAGFATIALILSMVGIYAMVAHSASQRKQEIGIRMALGAQRLSIFELVVLRGLKLAVIGVAIGVAASFALTRTMTALLVGVTPTDPATFVAVAILLITVALLASYVPARKAAKTDPMLALRPE